MDLRLNDEQLQSVLSTAILEFITPENRDAMIKEAVAYLLKTPPKEPFSNRTPDPPLQEAFKRAVSNAANKIAQELLEKPEYRAQVEDVMVAAFKITFVVLKEETVRKVAAAFVEAMTKTGC